MDNNGLESGSTLCLYNYILYIFEPERVKVDYAKLTWISWYITSV